MLSINASEDYEYTCFYLIDFALRLEVLAGKQTELDERLYILVRAVEKRILACTLKESRTNRY